MNAISAALAWRQHHRHGLPWHHRLFRRHWRGQLPIVAIVCAGVVWSLMASFFVWRWEEARARSDLADAAQNHFLALQHGLDEYLNKLAALRAFFEASGNVTRAEFETFAGRLLEGQNAIQNFSWVPRVRRSERVAVEAAAIRDGIPNYQIKEVTPEDKIVASPEKDEYLPILYSTLKDRRSPIYGIDLLSEPPIRERLERARDGNSLSAVPDFILHSAEGNVHGVIFSLPVYRNGMAIDTPEQRRLNLLGFAHGAVYISEAIENILKNRTTAASLDIYLFKSEDSRESAPLHIHSSRLRSSPAPALSRAQLDSGPNFYGLVSAGDTYWVLAAVPIRGGPLTARHDRALLVLVSSLLLTLGATLYMRSAARHTRTLMQANLEISNLAQRDSLTGLANRRAFNERLAAAFASGRRTGRSFAVLYFDLDHFKDTNDTLGHPAGDILLQQVASRMQDIIRKEDVLARFGGDEFAILQADADPAGATVLASNLTKILAAPFKINNDIVQLSASIGIAHYAADVASPDTLMMQADLALYRAKEDGRNCFRFHSADLDREVHERVVVAEELRNAVERGEMRLHYQPEVDLASGCIIGVEALLRWQHPTRGLLKPEHFISIAERSGTISALGEWAFGEACRQTRVWRDLGLAPGVVAVNVSANQFKANNGFDEFLAAMLRKWHVPPSAIEIELTESVLMDVTAQHNESLERVRHLGMKIAIDDFGTGYSSLDYLASYPVNRLKIAQELVMGVPGELRHVTVVRAAIQLANELKIDCVAEGIETAEQIEFLKTAGCAHGQGHYFSEPVSAERMTVLLRRGACARKGEARQLVRAG